MHWPMEQKDIWLFYKLLNTFFMNFLSIMTAVRQIQAYLNVSSHIEFEIVLWLCRLC